MSTVSEMQDPYWAHHEAGQKRQYGCVECQQVHTEGDELFEKHIGQQSKHGWYWIDRDGRKIQ